MHDDADKLMLDASHAEIIRRDLEAQINSMHEELLAAQQTTAALDEQKHENLLLKETIDRMRFEMDEMRTNASGAGAGGGGTGSVKGSVSKSLGAELLSKMKQLGDDNWGMEDEGQDEHQDELSAELEDGGDTEDEDVIQTIITRTKRVR